MPRLKGKAPDHDRVIVCKKVRKHLSKSAATRTQRRSLLLPSKGLEVNTAGRYSVGPPCPSSVGAGPTKVSSLSRSSPMTIPSFTTNL